MSDQNDPRIEAMILSLEQHAAGEFYAATELRDIATAAIAAADAVAPDIDAALDSVHPRCSVDVLGYLDDGWICVIKWFGEGDIYGNPFFGKGSTRTAAIMDAVQKAKAAQEGKGDE